MGETNDLPLLTEKKAPVTSATIRQGMLATWAAPEYAIMWEVGDATGARHTRLADAVIMSLWPSRGLELHGVEIKVSRSDWRREAADPKKAEAIGAYCDRWWVHTAPGVVHDLAEVPPLWGLREFDGKRWATIREAQRNPEPKVVTRQFLAALLRRADTAQRQSTYEAAERMIAADRAAFEDRIKSEVQRRTNRQDECRRIVEAFEEASGLKMEGWNADGSAKEIGALIKLIQESGLLRTWESIVSARATAERVLLELDEHIQASGLPYPKPNPLERFKKRRAA